MDIIYIYVLCRIKKKLILDACSVFVKIRTQRSFNNATHTVICEVWNFTDDISLKGEVWVHITSLNLPLSTEVPVIYLEFGSVQTLVFLFFILLMYLCWL